MRSAIKSLYDTVAMLGASDRPVIVVAESGEWIHVKCVGGWWRRRYRIDVVTQMGDDPESSDYVVVTTYPLSARLDEVPKIVAVGRFDDQGVARFPDEDDGAPSRRPI